MQKIIVDNFGPIRHAEIQLAPVVLIIGEQASGKSTLAKLIYFFKGVSSLFFSRFYDSSDCQFDIDNQLISPIRDRFYEMFGSTLHMPLFVIKYWYSDTRYVELKTNEDKRLKVSFSDGFFTEEFIQEILGYKKSLQSLHADAEASESMVAKMSADKKEFAVLRRLADCISNVFSTHHVDSLYILAGRNATVGYSDFFEDMLSFNLRKNIENQGKIVNEHKTQTIDEALMLDFMQKVSKIKQILSNGGNFEGIIHNSDGQKRRWLDLARRLVYMILKGQYSNSGDGERIVFPDGKFVYLKNASSGQQEAIRILQDAFLNIHSENPIFRIIEEPEAHLYPEAQYLMMQMLALSVNANECNELLITTHSPYVLSSFNNLIYAWQVGEKFKTETERVIDRECWVNPEYVRAYVLSNGESESIMAKDLDLIKVEKIDAASEIMNRQFDILMDLESHEE